MSRTKHSFMAGARDVSPILLGLIPFALVTGAAVVDAGFGVAEAVGMSLLVNAGAAQLAATKLYIEGAPLLIVIATALVINARMFIYSTSLAPVIAPEGGKWNWVLGHPLVDQSYAATMTYGRVRADVDVVPYYVGSWVILASVWQVFNIIGALGGAFVPQSWSLDFAVPLVFLAMLAPVLKGRINIEVASASAISAAILVPILPMQTGLFAAIVIGMVWGAVRDKESPAEEVSP